MMMKMFQLIGLFCGFFFFLKALFLLVHIHCMFIAGWPAFHQSNVHSSPLLYDIDKDGVREIVLATYNGVVNFFR
jgi:hypothetical protein